MTPTLEQLSALFTVDVSGGRMFWKHPPKHHPRLRGKEAGGVRPNHAGKKYWVIKIGKVAHKRARLIFLVARGHLPTPCVDHINGDSLDDRIVNLREATVLQNAWNHKRRKRGSSLPMGVRTVTNSSRYQARLAVNGKMIHLGCFDSVEQAATVYRQAREKHYGEFA